MNGLNVFIFLAALVTFESLQDVYMQGGISVEWRTKMKSGVSKITGEPFDDSMLGLFLESFVDNSFQKLDLLKVLIWANTGLIFINSVEDKLQEAGGIIKTGILKKILDFKIASKFSKVGGTAGAIRDLVVQKEEKLKRTSDYMYQATSVGSSMLNSANTASIPKIYEKNNLDKLSPKDQATFKSVMAMLNTVQGSR